MTQIILAHNHFDVTSLTQVITKMMSLGTPTIRVYHIDGDIYQAIEGCHRLRAAAALGLTPEFEELDHDTLRNDVDGLDYEDGSDPADTTISSIGDIYNTQLSFDVEI